MHGRRVAMAVERLTRVSTCQTLETCMTHRDGAPCKNTSTHKQPQLQRPKVDKSQWQKAGWHFKFPDRGMHSVYLRTQTSCTARIAKYPPLVAASSKTQQYVSPHAAPHMHSFFAGVTSWPMHNLQAVHIQLLADVAESHFSMCHHCHQLYWLKS